MRTRAGRDARCECGAELVLPRAAGAAQNGSGGPCPRRGPSGCSGGETDCEGSGPAALRGAGGGPWALVLPPELPHPQRDARAVTGTRPLRAVPGAPQQAQCTPAVTSAPQHTQCTPAVTVCPSIPGVPQYTWYTPAATTTSQQTQCTPAVTATPQQ